MADAVGEQGRVPRAAAPVGAGAGEGAHFLVAVLLHRRTRVALFVVLELVGVVELKAEIAEAGGRDPVARGQVHAGHLAVGDVDRAAEHRHHLAERIVRIGHAEGIGVRRAAGHPRDDVGAGRRAGGHLHAVAGAAGAAVAALALEIEDVGDVEIADLVVDGHAPVVGTERQVVARVPHQAGAPRLAGLAVELEVAGAGDVVAVVQRLRAAVRAEPAVDAGAHIGVFLGAGAAGGEQVVHVRRAEGGVVGAAHQQAFDRAPFDAGVPGEVAFLARVVVVAVEAAGGGQVQGLEQRQLELDAGRVALALAAALVGAAGLVVELVGAEGQRIGIEAITLRAGLDHAGEADRTGRQFEQVAAERELGLVHPRLGAALAARGELAEGLRRHRVPEPVLVQRIHRQAVVGAQLRAEEIAVDRALQHAREAEIDLVLGAADGGVPVEALAEAAAQAGGEVPGTFAGVEQERIAAARFGHGEGAARLIAAAGVLVVERAAAVEFEAQRFVLARFAVAVP